MAKEKTPQKKKMQKAKSKARKTKTNKKNKIKLKATKTKLKTNRQIQVNDNALTAKSRPKSKDLVKSIDKSINIVNDLCDNLWWEYSDTLAMHVKVGAIRSDSAANFQQFDEESKRAAVLFTKQEALFNMRKTKDKDAKWLSTMMRNGTMSDRVSASTLSVQQNPVFSIKILLSLVSMAMKNNQREAQLAITALKDLFMNNLMPSDRKLKYFAQQPVSHPRISAKVPEAGSR